MERQWFITDACGVNRTVKGEGVVGMKPKLEPGESFSYSSYCPLSVPFGQMEGFYLFKTPENTMELGITICFKSVKVTKIKMMAKIVAANQSGLFGE